MPDRSDPISDLLKRNLKKKHFVADQNGNIILNDPRGDFNGGSELPGIDARNKLGTNSYGWKGPGVAGGRYRNPEERQPFLAARTGPVTHQYGSTSEGAFARYDTDNGKALPTAFDRESSRKGQRRCFIAAPTLIISSVPVTEDGEIVGVPEYFETIGIRRPDTKLPKSFSRQDGSTTGAAPPHSGRIPTFSGRKDDPFHPFQRCGHPNDRSKQAEGDAIKRYPANPRVQSPASEKDEGRKQRLCPTKKDGSILKQVGRDGKIVQRKIHPQPFRAKTPARQQTPPPSSGSSDLDMTSPLLKRPGLGEESRVKRLSRKRLNEKCQEWLNEVEDVPAKDLAAGFRKTRTDDLAGFDARRLLGKVFRDTHEKPDSDDNTRPTARHTLPRSTPSLKDTTNIPRKIRSDMQTVKKKSSTEQLARDAFGYPSNSVLRRKVHNEVSELKKRGHGSAGNASNRVNDILTRLPAIKIPSTGQQHTAPPLTGATRDDRVPASVEPRTPKARTKANTKKSLIPRLSSRFTAFKAGKAKPAGTFANPDLVSCEGDKDVDDGTALKATDIGTLPPQRLGVVTGVGSERSMSRGRKALVSGGGETAVQDVAGSKKPEDASADKTVGIKTPRNKAAGHAGVGP